jgi:hypothetical protein
VQASVGVDAPQFIEPPSVVALEPYPHNLAGDAQRGLRQDLAERPDRAGFDHLPRFVCSLPSSSADAYWTQIPASNSARRSGAIFGEDTQRSYRIPPILALST